MKKCFFIALFLMLAIVSGLCKGRMEDKSLDGSGIAYKMAYDMQDLLDQDMEKSQLDSWNKRILIEVKNPNNYDLYSAPVIIPIDDPDIDNSTVVPGSFFVATQDLAYVALAQVDDTDMDGVMDELVFIADIRANSSEKFYIYYSEGGRIWQFPERNTDAIALPGWESELAGYRSYSSFILDTFAKPIDNPNLLLRALYDEQLRQLYNHHTESGIGMDTLNVGTTSGLGGVVYVLSDGTKLQPSDGGLQSEVLISGPVRSVVQFTKDPIITDAGTVTITRTATIYAHHFETQITDTITIKNGNADGQYGIGLTKTGIVEYEAIPQDGILIEWLNQHSSIGEHGIGIYLDPSDISRVGEDDADNYVCVKDSTSGNKTFTVDFVAFAQWKKAGYVADADEFKEFAYFVVDQQSPVEVSVISSETK